MQRYNSPNEQHEKPKKSPCTSENSDDVISLVSKVSDAKTQLQSLTTKIGNIIEDNFKHPIAMTQLPRELMEEFNIAITAGQDLQGAAHYAYCAEPSLRRTLIAEVRSLEKTKTTLQSTTGNVPDSGPISGIKHMVSNVEGLVSEAIKGIAAIVSTQISPSNPDNAANSEGNSGSSDGSQGASSSDDPYAAFSNYGSTATPGSTGSISDNAYAAFSDYATISNVDPSSTKTANARQMTPTNEPAQYGTEVFSTKATFKFTVTERDSHRNQLTFTFTAWPTFTFSKSTNNKRSAGIMPSETSPVILDGIDQGDGMETSDSGYTYNSDSTYSHPSPTHTAVHATTSTTSYLFTGTEGVFPHASISFVQHETAPCSINTTLTSQF